MIRPRPRPTTLSLAAFALAVASVALGTARPARAQPERPFGEQTHVFRRLLYDMKFTPVAGFNEVNPKDTVVVWLGSTAGFYEQVPDKFPGFIEAGGAVLLATDRPEQAALEKYLGDPKQTGFSVAPAHYIYAGSDESLRYQGLSFCPILQPVVGATPNLFRNPNEPKTPLIVATNVPSRLVHHSENTVRPRRLATGVTELAKLPDGCFIDANFRQYAKDGIMVIAWQPNAHARMLFLADHSIFINQMMLPDDNNNVEFTANCMAWLSEDGQRKRVLFVEEGQINATFDVPIQELPQTTPPDLERRIVNFINRQADRANEHLEDAEQRDLFNHWTHRFLSENDRISPWRAVGALFVLLTLVALVVGFLRLAVHGFQQQQPIAPSLARLVQQQGPTESLMEQRSQGMFQVNNLWEVGRQLARQTFAAAGVAGTVGDPPPPVAVQGGWWERRHTQREVAELWALAFGRKPRTVSPAQWPALLRQLGALRGALTDGKVRLG